MGTREALGRKGGDRKDNNEIGKERRIKERTGVGREGKDEIGKEEIWKKII